MRTLGVMVGIVVAAVCLSAVVLNVDGLGAPVGAWTELKMYDETVQSHAKFAVEEIRKLNNGPYCTALIKIVNAWTQVVSGINYNITFHQGYTNQPVSQNGCTTDANAAYTKTEKCTVIVWDRAWIKPGGTQLTSQTCRASYAAQLV